MKTRKFKQFYQSSSSDDYETMINDNTEQLLFTVVDLALRNIINTLFNIYLQKESEFRETSVKILNKSKEDAANDKYIQSKMDIL